MSDHLTQPLAELKTAIVADGVVDAEEAAQLRERLYADGVIDRDEAEFLFDVNDAVSGNANDPAWQALFVDSICDYLLKDEASPGEVDGDEAAWLLERVQRDNQLDNVERALLNELANRATSMDDKLKAFIASS